MKVKKSHIFIASGLLVATIATAVILKRVKKNKRVKEGLESGTGGSTSLIGKTVSLTKEGYVNVRSSAEVDNKNYCNELTGIGYDCTDNKIGKSTSNPVGTIAKTVTGADSMIWYHLNLSSPINGKSKGWVREDAVVVNK